MPLAEPLLICALSGRALAAVGPRCRASRRSCSTRFGDLDTQAMQPRPWRSSCRSTGTVRARRPAAGGGRGWRRRRCRWSGASGFDGVARSAGRPRPWPRAAGQPAGAACGGSPTRSPSPKPVPQLGVPQPGGALPALPADPDGLAGQAARRLGRLACAPVPPRSATWRKATTRSAGCRASRLGAPARRRPTRRWRWRSASSGRRAAARFTGALLPAEVDGMAGESRCARRPPPWPRPHFTRRPRQRRLPGRRGRRASTCSRSTPRPGASLEAARLAWTCRWSGCTSPPAAAGCPTVGRLQARAAPARRSSGRDRDLPMPDGLRMARLGRRPHAGRHRSCGAGSRLATVRAKRPEPGRDASCSLDRRGETLLAAHGGGRSSFLEWRSTGGLMAR